MDCLTQKVARSTDALTFTEDFHDDDDNGGDDDDDDDDSCGNVLCMDFDRTVCVRVWALTGLCVCVCVYGWV